MVPSASATSSIAQTWDEQILAAIRIDRPHPPVHARNLFTLSAAMYDAWAAYDGVAVGFVYRGKHSAGDVAAARRSYERAWGKDGSAAAAYGLARSYDPLVLPTLPATNATPDKGQAMQWYKRAAAAGHADAAKAITRLQVN